MSTLSVIITILSVIAGFASQAVSSGSLFGIVTIPKAWLPYVSLIGTFLVGFTASLTTAGPVSGATIMAAIMAGLAALTGTAVGVTCHQHIMAAKKAANDNAKAKAAAAPPPAAAA